MTDKKVYRHRSYGDVEFVGDDNNLRVYRRVHNGHVFKMTRGEEDIQIVSEKPPRRK